MKEKPLSPDLDKIELHPDAWERTERAIKSAVRHAPMHKKAPARPQSSKTKGSDS